MGNSHLDHMPPNSQLFFLSCPLSSNVDKKCSYASYWHGKVKAMQCTPLLLSHAFRIYKQIIPPTSNCAEY